MKVVIDSTVICQDFRMSGVQFVTLREKYGLVPIALKVPEVVIDEVTNKYRETLATTKSKAFKELKHLARLFAPDDPRRIELGVIDVESETKKYKEFLIRNLSLYGAEILPYTTINHKDVVERDLKRRKPFKENGAGYRDYLIWQNVKSLMISGHERVVFVTSNSSDFGSNGILAQELKEDLFNPDNLELLPDIKALNDKYIARHLKLLDESKYKIRASIDSQFDLESWIKSGMLELIREFDMGSVIAGFPDGVGSTYASDIVAINSFHVEEVRKLSEESRIISFNANVDVDFSINVAWSDYVNFEEVRDYFGQSSEIFDYASLNSVENIELGIQIIIDDKKSDPVDSEITSVSGPYGEIS